MPRTYTSYVQDGKAALPWQAIVMFEFIASNRVTLSLDEIERRIEKFSGDTVTNYLSTICCRLVRLHYLERSGRGIYTMTKLGRSVWTRVFQFRFDRRQGAAKVFEMPKRKMA